MNMTSLETKVYNVIKEKSNPEMMECVDIKDVVKGTGESAKVVRGALSSLVKKDMIEVEEFDGNFKIRYFYWLKGAFDEPF